MATNSEKISPKCYYDGSEIYDYNESIQLHTMWKEIKSANYLDAKNLLDKYKAITPIQEEYKFIFFDHKSFDESTIADIKDLGRYYHDLLCIIVEGNTRIERFMYWMDLLRSKNIELIEYEEFGELERGMSNPSDFF